MKLHPDFSWALVLQSLGRARKFVVAVIRRFRADRCSRVAGALSFTTILAIVPLTAVTLSVLSVFPVFDKWMTAMQSFMYGNFVPAAGDVVQRYLTQFAAKAGRLTAFGIGFLFVTAILLMVTIEDAFNDIWRTPVRRKIVHRFLAYWAVLTLGPILIGAGISLSVMLATTTAIPERSVLDSVRDGVTHVLPFGFELSGFLLLYFLVPSGSVRPAHAVIGAVVAALLFEIAKRAFSWFVLSFSTYQVVYGAIAALPVFLLWVYLSWVVTLLGGVVAATLGQRDGGTPQGAGWVSFKSRRARTGSAQTRRSPR